MSKWDYLGDVWVKGQMVHKFALYYEDVIEWEASLEVAAAERKRMLTMDPNLKECSG
jgi:hypothetical protein